MADAADPVRPGSHVSLYFSDDIEAAGDAANDALLAKLSGVIEVNFNACIASVVHDELLEDILAAAARRSKLSNDASGIRLASAGDGSNPAGADSTSPPSGPALDIYRNVVGRIR